MRKLISFLCALLLPLSTQAGLIRDAEIESTLHAYERPILSSAGIPAENVRIFIVNDPAINSYVAGGLNIFVNTGLIRVTKSSDELIGVLAHETGHIAGAHLSQLSEKSSHAMLGGILGALAGAAVIAGGGGRAGAGVIMGSQSMAQRGLMSDIRLNEESADHAALRFLDENEISAAGMLSMFETLRRKEMGLSKPDPFARDHPLTTERIATIRNHISESTIPAGQVPAGFDEKHKRMIAKLVAFMDTYDHTITMYPPSDTSIAGRYARAIADYKRNHLSEALAGIDGLIKQSPDDPFFYDTKGQILFENGKVPDAEKAYAKAAELLPDSGLILTDYAKTLVAEDNPAALNKALALLERAKEVDDSNGATWRQLAIVYGKQGKLGSSYMALAEEAALSGDYKGVLQHVAHAREQTDTDASLQLVLSDLERDAKTQLKRKKGDDLF